MRWLRVLGFDGGNDQRVRKSLVHLQVDVDAEGVEEDLCAWDVPSISK